MERVVFISKLATKHQEINYIAADMIEAMLGLSKKEILKCNIKMTSFK